MITNWMGDDGFLKKLDDRFPYFHTGRSSRTESKVTKKYQEGGEYLVDMECTQRTSTGSYGAGTATSTPSRNDYKVSSVQQIT